MRKTKNEFSKYASNLIQLLHELTHINGTMMSAYIVYEEQQQNVL